MLEVGRFARPLNTEVAPVRPLSLLFLKSKSFEKSGIRLGVVAN